MPKRMTEVRLWNTVVGWADWDDERQCARFQYDPSFSDKGYDIAPYTMPLSANIFIFDSLNRDTYLGLPGLLSDSLPDNYGNTLINIWLSKNNIPKNEFTPLDRLCYVGKRGMGALEYRPVLKGTAVDEIIDVDMLASLAADVLRQRENIQTDLNDKGLKELMSVGTSAGGARAKAVVTVNESTGEIRSGQFDMSNKFTYWLIKFDTEKENKKGYCRIEHAYYEMASACGIDMTECRLLETGDNIHFMTKRFDRIGNEKVHMQTLCALAHYDFNVPGKYSYEEMVSVMRKLHMEYEETEQIFRRMVFNVIMKNHDDHTKNFSFLMGKNGKWKLSQAYDVTYAFDPTNYWISKHQMSVNGKIDDIERNDMKKFADLVGIKDPDDIIDSVLSTASEWKGYAKRSGVPKETADAVARNIGV